MPLYCWPAASIDGAHPITTDAIVDEFRAAHPGPVADRAPALAHATNISTRGWMLPLQAATRRGLNGLGLLGGTDGARRALAEADLPPESVERSLAALTAAPACQTAAERTKPAWEQVCTYGQRAAENALQRAGLHPRDVDALIVSNSTVPTLPGLDVHLVSQLGLRDDVMSIPVTQWACGASTRGLALAARLVAAHPDTVVLLVVSEALSTTYQPADNSIDALMTRLLFSDCAAAIAVTGRHRTGHWLRLDAAHHATLPHTAHLHRLESEADGVHFRMDRAGPRAMAASLPPIWQWLDTRYGPHWRPDLLLAHPGGPRVLEQMRDSLPDGWPPDLLDPTWRAYASGNRGGASVLDLLDRTRQYGTQPGARTVLYSASPGLHTTALAGETL
ncbi:beta-ketoacyl-[acyl-carrier-protein] synthase family protein [Streptomyces aureocirculatus]|uniref:polyketide synthase n=1 Tax=Streptomyces aureocirculatus TaxID=67275 RepID=UPI0004C499E3|nr:polyketide synthase [Streptomyces aureocirculatus]